MERWFQVMLGNPKMTIRQYQVHDMRYEGYDCTVVENGFDEKSVDALKQLGIPEPGIISRWWCGYVFLKDDQRVVDAHRLDTGVTITWDGTFPQGLAPPGKTTIMDDHVRHGPKEYRMIGFDLNHNMENGGSRQEAEDICKNIVVVLFDIGTIMRQKSA